MRIWERFWRWWLYVRSAVLWALSDAIRFVRAVLAGSVIVLATALISWVSGNGGAAAVALLGIPAGTAAMFVGFVAAHLLGRGGQWGASYRPYLGFEAKRLYLSGSSDFMFLHGVRCVVRSPAGIVSLRERQHVVNGFEFPGEFPELVPITPGTYRATWFARFAPTGRWWYLTRLDFQPDLPSGGG